MDSNALIEILKSGLSVAGSTINSIVGALITILFLRKNTTTTEFQKIKGAKFGEVINDLLDSGKMSYLEYWKCNNFFTIAKKADEARGMKEPEFVDSSKYDFDWFVKFYEYASSISNEEMQQIWAKVLAREVDEPSTTSFTLLHSLSMMSSEQAKFFGNISRFSLNGTDYYPNLLLFISTNRIAYENSRITPEKLKDLQRLGLIDCEFEKEFVFLDANMKSFRVSNKRIDVYGDPENENKILAGNAVFTKDGAALYSIIDDDYKQYRSDILDFTIAKFKARNCRVVINDREV